MPPFAKDKYFDFAEKQITTFEARKVERSDTDPSIVRTTIAKSKKNEYLCTVIPIVIRIMIVLLEPSSTGYKWWGDSTSPAL